MAERVARPLRPWVLFVGGLFVVVVCLSYYSEVLILAPKKVPVVQMGNQPPLRNGNVFVPEESESVEKTIPSAEPKELIPTEETGQITEVDVTDSAFDGSSIEPEKVASKEKDEKGEAPAEEEKVESEEKAEPEEERVKDETTVKEGTEDEKDKAETTVTEDTEEQKDAPDTTTAGKEESTTEEEEKNEGGGGEKADEESPEKDKMKEDEIKKDGLEKGSTIPKKDAIAEKKSTDQKLKEVLFDVRTVGADPKRLDPFLSYLKDANAQQTVCQVGLSKKASLDWLALHNENRVISYAPSSGDDDDLSADVIEKLAIRLAVLNTPLKATLAHTDPDCSIYIINGTALLEKKVSVPGSIVLTNRPVTVFLSLQPCLKGLKCSLLASDWQMLKFTKNFQDLGRTSVGDMTYAVGVLAPGQVKAPFMTEVEKRIMQKIVSMRTKANDRSGFDRFPLEQSAMRLLVSGDRPITVCEVNGIYDMAATVLGSNANSKYYAFDDCKRVSTSAIQNAYNEEAPGRAQIICGDPKVTLLKFAQERKTEKCDVISLRGLDAYYKAKDILLKLENVAHHWTMIVMNNVNCKERHCRQSYKAW
eukprot:CAMPEP_0184646474 /NCGR_PEP_ID=MMETSP0308-20130426/3168_1 /TAXON_ID=38269 /ORGANISM="Gloeochaete witrockiana, Strain SAG 46.84" /LENGTH=589 /DNA_ID=CAMNT_0027076503 /DNA_START=136 /DNA_END=1902 /DNA_ORIENTATION=-